MWGSGHEWGMMGGWGGGTWWGPLGMIIWLLILALIIAGVVWLVRAMARPNESQSHQERRLSGLDILEQRYARGEINRDEYLQKKQDMTR